VGVDVGFDVGDGDGLEKVLIDVEDEVVLELEDVDVEADVDFI